MADPSDPPRGRVGVEAGGGTAPGAPRLNRRQLLRLGGALGVLAAVPARVLAQLADASAAGDGAGVFLDAAQLRALRALCGHFIPGPPDDPDPGALEAGVAEYIDLMLGAFQLPRPPVFAGGPFSRRDVSGAENDFANFLGLDALEERIWRTRIEGSRGRPEREWNGPVVGWQERYASGLALLDATARGWRGADFADLSPRRKRWLVRFASDELEAFLDLAWQHTLEGMYGPPEYGGNRERVGWGYTRWPGDHQPMSYTWEQVARADADQAEAEAQALRNAEKYLGRKLERG